MAVCAGSSETERSSGSRQARVPAAIVKLLLALLGTALFGLYLTINALSAGRPARSLETPLDRAIPFRPAWTYVYVAAFVFPFLPLALVRHLGVFKRTVAAFAAVLLFCCACYLVFPVRIERPTFPIESLATWGLGLTYTIDHPYNCFPSFHLGSAFLTALVAWRLDRAIGAGAFLLATLIGVSTLFTKQHFAADVAAGILVAYAAFRAIVARHVPDLPRLALTYGRPVTLVIPAAYTVAVAISFLLYRAGSLPFSWPPPPH